MDSVFDIRLIDSGKRMAGFERLGVMPEIIRAIEDMGWLLQTPVQDEVPHSHALHIMSQIRVIDKLTRIRTVVSRQANTYF